MFLNCAVSRDGRLAAQGGAPVLLSDDVDLRRVHRLRAQCDAILVGIGTVLADDPHLTVKADHAGEEAEHPLRVVLDAYGRIPPDARALDDAAPTLVVTGPDAAPVPGARQLRVAMDLDGRLDLEELLRALAGLGVESVMVEGGEAVLRSFLDTDLWDRLTIYEAPMDLGEEGPGLWRRSADELGLQGEAAPQGAGRLWTFTP